MATVTFSFVVDQRVKIVEIDMVGVVDALMLEGRNKLYRVVYWHNGERYAGWLNDAELERVK